MSPASTDLAQQKVIEFCEGFGVSALTGKLLADLGCRVTKLEPATGDTLRGGEMVHTDLSLFALVAGSKDSVCLDFDKVEAPLLRRIFAQADILVTDQDGWARICAVVGGSLHELAPQLTICVCTAFGLDGPMASWRGGEDIVQAMSGIASTTSHQGGRPTRIASQTVTHTTALHAVSAILGDLLLKRQSGRGALLEACMFDTAISLLTAAMPAYFLEGVAPRGIGNRHTMAAPWNSFRCADGWAIICAGNDPTWNRLCEAIGRRDLLSDPLYATQESRVRNVVSLEAEITAWTARRSVERVEALMDEQGIPCGSILSLEQVLDHPQFATRGLLRDCGVLKIAGAVFHRNGAPLPVLAGACDLGAGNHLLARRFGLSDAEITRLLAEGVLVDPKEKVDATAA
jgi:crotonobetainyl-CoA:carnitine CoA-transferase CaiB-like acyl-CoA transferase